MNDQLTGLIKGKEFKVVKNISLPQILVPRKILEETQKQLLSFSRDKEFFEGIVYWAGKKAGRRFLVTEVVLPKATVTPVSFRVSSFENARIMANLVKRGMQLIAQVHSHPARLGLNYNLLEEEIGFPPHNGFFSLVVGSYAQEGLLPLAEKTGVYLYGKNAFARLNNKQIQSCFKILP